MTLPVRIEAKAWTDSRYATVALYLGLSAGDAEIALIRCAAIWRWQTEHYTEAAPTYVVPEGVVVGALKSLDGPRALVAAAPPGGGAAIAAGPPAEHAGPALDDPDGLTLTDWRARISLSTCATRPSAARTRASAARTSGCCAVKRVCLSLRSRLTLRCSSRSAL